MPDNSSLADFAAALLDARHSGVAMEGTSAEDGPVTLPQAHAVQAMQMAKLGPVGAWKIAAAKAGKTHKWCPIPLSAVSLASHGSTYPIYDNVEIEIEIGLLLGKDIPARDIDYRPEEMLDYVASFHPCIELLSSRYADRHAVTEAQGMADLQSNLAVIAGPPLASLAKDVFTTAIQFSLGGADIAHTKAMSPLDDVVSALANLANHAAKYGFALARDHIVITGARIGPVALPAHATASIGLHGAAPLVIEFTAATQVGSASHRPGWPGSGVV